MCRPTTCRTCAKTTWAGCGEHIEQVRAQVPADQWCPGHPVTEPAARTEGEERSLLRRILGR